MHLSPTLLPPQSPKLPSSSKRCCSILRQRLFAVLDSFIDGGG